MEKGSMVFLANWIGTLAYSSLRFIMGKCSHSNSMLLVSKLAMPQESLSCINWETLKKIFSSETMSPQLVFPFINTASTASWVQIEQILMIVRL